MSNSKFYPRWIKRPDGADIIVHNHHQHSAHMGQEFGEDAEPIVAQEPEPPPPPPPPAELMAGTTPFYPEDEDLDPLGIFEPGPTDEPIEQQPTRRRRKKSATSVEA